MGPHEHVDRTSEAFEREENKNVLQWSDDDREAKEKKNVWVTRCRDEI